MPTKHNKKRYQSAVKEKKLLNFSGRIFLQYRDEEAMEGAGKGDLLFYPSVEALHTIRQGEYDSTGYAGYFKVDVHDGRDWKPVLMSELFPEREHYFSKSECPIDTFALCRELLEAREGLVFARTYREHYGVEE